MAAEHNINSVIFFARRFLLPVASTGRSSSGCLSISTPSLVSTLCQRKVTNEIICKDSGELQLSVGRETARIQWRPMPIYEPTVFDYKNLPDQVKPYVLASKGATKNGFRFTSQPTGTPDQFMSLMLESLRNTLARKRDQFRDKSERYVLILKLGHHRTTSEQLHELFRDRIGPTKIMTG